MNANANPSPRGSLLAPVGRAHTTTKAVRETIIDINKILGLHARMPNELATRLSKQGTTSVENLIYPIRHMQEAWAPEGAERWAADVMKNLSRTRDDKTTTYAVLNDETLGMTEPFAETAELLAMLYADDKDRHALRTCSQVLDAHGNVPKTCSLMAGFGLETGDAMIFDRLMQHARRVHEFRTSPREQVTPEKLEALYHEMRMEMTEVLSISSRIEQWNVDSSRAAASKPVRGPAEGEVPRRTDSGTPTRSARPEEPRRRRR